MPDEGERKEGQILTLEEARDLAPWDLVVMWEQVPEELRDTIELRMWLAYSHMAPEHQVPRSIKFEALPLLMTETPSVTYTDMPWKRIHADGFEIPDYEAGPLLDSQALDILCRIEYETATHAFIVDRYLFHLIVAELLPGEHVTEQVEEQESSAKKK